VVTSYVKENGLWPSSNSKVNASLVISAVKKVALETTKVNFMKYHGLCWGDIVLPSFSFFTM
jgi:hypothetical protein